LAGPTKKLFLNLILRKIIRMIRKFASLALFLTLTYSAIAQSTETKKTRRPDIPGTFTLELGLNRLTEKPLDLKYGLWGSRTLNVYYQYEMRILKSKFSFHPGIGMGMERIKLMNYKQYYANDTVTLTNPTLMYDAVGNSTFVDAAHYIYDGDTLGQMNYSSSYTTKKSMLVMNYLDIPIEFRWSSNPEDPARSVKVALGGRVGYLVNAHTKLRYRESGDIKKLKQQEDFNLNRFRYGVSMKVYFGNFALFGYYNLNPLFKENRGPGATEAQSYTVGISLSSF
jgi:hypothetical protein